MSKETSSRTDIVHQLILFVSRRYLLVVGVLSAIIGLIVFWDFVFFKKLYLFTDIASDSVNISYPAYVHMADYLRTHGLPRWSFAQGMGQSIFPFAFSDPFSFVLYLLGKARLAYGLTYLELLKIVAAAIVFALFLKTRGLSAPVSALGGLLFGFSGYTILGSGWYGFTIEALYCALFLLSLERLYRFNSWPLLPIVVALIAALQPFYLYTFGIFGALYAIFRILEDKGWAPREIAVLLAKCFGLGLLGVGMSSLFVVTDITMLLDSPRIGGRASYSGLLSAAPIFGFGDPVHNITVLFRAFGSDLLGTGLKFSGWQNYLEAPLFYCGLISLLMIPHAFVYANARERIARAAFLCVWLVPVIFPFFRYAFWLFAGNYYRTFSLFFVVVILLQSAEGMAGVIRRKRVQPVVLTASLIVLLGLLYLPIIPPSVKLNGDLRDLCAILLVLYAGVMFAVSRGVAQVPLVAVLSIVVFAELTAFGSITVNKRSCIPAAALSEKAGYNDFSVDAANYLKSIDQEFFRIDKYYSSGPAVHGSLNDAKVQGYYGTASYHQFNQPGYIRFLGEMGVISDTNEFQTRWVPGLRTRPVLESLASVKYALTKDEGAYLLPFHFEQIERFGDVRVFRNTCSLPLGFRYGSWAPLSQLRKLPPKSRELAVLKTLMIDDADTGMYSFLPAYRLDDTAHGYSLDAYPRDVQVLRSDTLSISRRTESTIEGTVAFSAPGVLFLSIPFDKGWHARVDGKETPIRRVQIGFSGVIVDKGFHRIAMSFMPPFLLSGSIMSAVCLVLYGFLFIRCRKRTGKVLT
jgi:hypothetical protein